MDRRRYLATISATVGSAVGLAGCTGDPDGTPTGGASAGDPAGDSTEDTPAGGDTPAGTDSPDGTDSGETDTREAVEVRVESVATNLEIPWGAAWRDGVLHLTERPGRVVRVVDGEREELADLTDRIAARGEGGLLGLVFHPDDPETAYTYQTYRADEGLANRVVRHDVADGWRGEAVFDGIPGGVIHDGGRLAVSQKNALYVTCGDAGDAERAQDRNALNGKVLRLTLDGEPHPDNPFGTAVFTYGHRNPQGLAFRGGELYSTEHGPATDDEINRLVAGNNYGWPVVKGFEERERFTDPLAAYTPTIAPGSAAFYDGPIPQWRGDFFFGTLAGTHLHRARITADDRVVENERLYDGEFGRLRTAFTGPDGHLYVTTSNRDGRASGRFPRPKDDRVLRFRPT